MDVFVDWCIDGFIKGDYGYWINVGVFLDGVVDCGFE